MMPDWIRRFWTKSDAVESKAEVLLPDDLSALVWQYAHLTPPEQAKLRGDAAVVYARKNWEGCGGLGLHDDMRAMVSAQIALLTLGFDRQHFDRVQSILLFPGVYTTKSRTSVGGGFAIEEHASLLGEAWYRGPVSLSWPAVQAAARGTNRGRHIVVHEFAHQLDTLNGRDADGVPVIESASMAQDWLSATGAAYDRLRHACELGNPAALDCYGATNRAEFFAVASEMFFQLPRRLQQSEPELFAVLADYYQIDPLRWSGTK